MDLQGNLPEKEEQFLLGVLGEAAGSKGQGLCSGGPLGAGQSPELSSTVCGTPPPRSTVPHLPLVQRDQGPMALLPGGARCRALIQHVYWALNAGPGPQPPAAGRPRRTFQATEAGQGLRESDVGSSREHFNVGALCSAPTPAVRARTVPPVPMSPVLQSGMLWVILHCRCDQVTWGHAGGMAPSLA